MATIKLNWSICPFCDCFGKTVLRRIDWEEFEEHPNIFDFCCLRKLHNSYVLFFKTTTLCSLKVQFWSVAVLSKTNITNTYRTFHQFSLIVAMHHFSILKEYNFHLCRVFFQRTPALAPIYIFALTPRLYNSHKFPKYTAAKQWNRIKESKHYCCHSFIFMS